MIGVVVITHGTFGEGLLSTAQDMVGRQEQILFLSVSSDVGPHKLAEQILDVQSRWEGQAGVLYLVDMLGGTPCNQALLQTKDRQSEVVTGVNLYMVLSAFKNRAQMTLSPLAARVGEDGRKSIVVPRDLLNKTAQA